MKRSDLNQSAIIKCLRAVGCSVAVTSQLGYGFPDIVVGYMNKNYLFEIKNNSTHGKLNDSQLAFHSKWKGKIFIVYSIQDIYKILGVIGYD